MKARIAITIIAVILYVGLFNIYWYELTRINIRMSKMFYYALTSFSLTFFIADLKAGFVNSYHKQFNLLLFFCILINTYLIFATHAHWIPDERTNAMYYAFNLSVFFITLTIFICELKYKTFRD